MPSTEGSDSDCNDHKSLRPLSPARVRGGGFVIAGGNNASHKHLGSSSAAVEKDLAIQAAAEIDRSVWCDDKLSVSIGATSLAHH